MNSQWAAVAAGSIWLLARVDSTAMVDDKPCWRVRVSTKRLPDLEDLA